MLGQEPHWFGVAGVTLGYLAAMGLLAACILRSKGYHRGERSFTLWVVSAALLGPLALIVLLAMPKYEPPHVHPGLLRPLPCCRPVMVDAAYRYCPHCGERLPPADPSEIMTLC